MDLVSSEPAGPPLPSAIIGSIMEMQHKNTMQVFIKFLSIKLDAPVILQILLYYSNINKLHIKNRFLPKNHL